MLPHRQNESTQTPPQHSQEDVLRWIDSISGHAPGGMQGYDAPGQRFPLATYPQQGGTPYAQAPGHYAQQPGAPYAQHPAGMYAQAPMGTHHQMTGQYAQSMAGQNARTSGYPYPQHTGHPHGQYHPQQFQQGSSAGGGQTQPFAVPGMSQEDYAAYYDDYDGSSQESYADDDGRGRGRHTGSIALDPSQPRTVDGRPRVRVFVACDRCRHRKLRCDGARPVCFNCQKAAAMCQYDPTPKRRGQDKAPRTRSAVGTRQPRKPATKKDGSTGQDV
ncbi:hypothetical protein C8Q79DRAFT_438191 [Trametes meyenii]|nr:hypothetical protein C8Q79DRAFT_438191 [Trametes meyenii]